ncbi:MAG TPA: hypothetical protein VM103_00665 [Candidatus Paceibacterota bacterium]|nr:hypothetical protein [Candidatus Paceibacterota bacterium]
MYGLNAILKKVATGVSDTHGFSVELVTVGLMDSAGIECLAQYQDAFEKLVTASVLRKEQRYIGGKKITLYFPVSSEIAACLAGCSLDEAGNLFLQEPSCH